MAPKRIYLQWHGDSDPAEIGEPDETGVTWSRFREFEGDVRYTRTDLYMEAIARAEAAEKRLAELEAENELLTYEIGHEIVERNRYLANLAAAAECTPDDNEFPDALTDRIVNAITDLRTKLAAQGWQPVTDPPTDNGDYLATPTRPAPRHHGY